MPRRKKEENMTYEERIRLIDEQIAHCKEELSSLRARRKELESSNEEEAMQGIYEFVRDAHMTPSEFLARLREQPEGQETPESPSLVEAG